MAFFGLFEKKANFEELFAALKTEQERGNLVEVANMYFELGEAFFKKGDKEKALLYMNRFDVLSTSQDHINSKIPKKKIDRAAEVMGKIRTEDIYMIRIRNKVREMSKDLTGQQRIKWNLLTLARFNVLFNKLSENPAFELLGKFGDILFILLKGYDASVEEAKILSEFVEEFYPFIDSVDMADVENGIKFEEKADFEGYDLIGNNIMMNMYTLMDDLSRVFGGEKISDEIKSTFVTNGIICDYFIRTRECPLEENKEVKEEEARIFDDYKFINSSPTDEEFWNRMKEYGTVNLI